MGPARTLPRATSLGAALLIATLLVALGAATPAFAYNEANLVIVPNDGFGNCSYCHNPGSINDSYGPHGNYSSGLNVCRKCHSVHAGTTGSVKLLPRVTIGATCMMCHNGTGGTGIYGSITARGLAVAGKHRYEVTATVPGGDATDGGSSTPTFRGSGGTLTCSDCHSPHGNDVVTAFLGERMRTPHALVRDVVTSSRLLKRHPGGSAASIADYGSDWCLACHKGRASAGIPVHNHPVESSATTGTPYVYRRLGIIGAGPYPTSETTIGAAGVNTRFTGYTRAYLMPYPRTGAQAGHLPICQQCHEDERNAGTLSADGSQATPATETLTVGQFDGTIATDNPRFYTFPHETTAYRMLVEADAAAATDDLCLNCHPPAVLP